MATDIHIIGRLSSSDHLPVGQVVSTCVTADKFDSVPTENKVLKSFPFLNVPRRMIIIWGNMETVALCIWTKYTSQSHLHVLTLTVQTN